MNYGIYFDESNKLDQPNGDYSYYGALGTTQHMIDEIVNVIQMINNKLRTKSEMHFVNYTSDTHFEKYFRVLNFVLEQDIKINLMMVNKEDAIKIASEMEVSLSDLRSLFYVKIPERLFYGMTRDLINGQHVQIVIDENSEYEKLELETKLEEQMNAHSAYRNKGYKVDAVKQAPSDDNIPLQLIDVFMGIVVFLLEGQYKRLEFEKENITLMVKSDLVYRLIIHKDNLNRLHNKINLFKWEGAGDQINRMGLSEFTGEFLIYKTQLDIQEMNKLSKLRLEYPHGDTRFYREEMGYSTRQLRMVQGYLAELSGNGRNSYYR